MNLLIKQNKSKKQDIKAKQQCRRARKSANSFQPVFVKMWQNTD